MNQSMLARLAIALLLVQETLARYPSTSWVHYHPCKDGGCGEDDSWLFGVIFFGFVVVFLCLLVCCRTGKEEKEDDESDEDTGATNSQPSSNAEIELTGSGSV